MIFRQKQNERDKKVYKTIFFFFFLCRCGNFAEVRKGSPCIRSHGLGVRSSRDFEPDLHAEEQFRRNEVRAGSPRTDGRPGSFFGKLVPITHPGTLLTYLFIYSNPSRWVEKHSSRSIGETEKIANFDRCSVIKGIHHYKFTKLSGYFEIERTTTSLHKFILVVPAERHSTASVPSVCNARRL